METNRQIIARLKKLIRRCPVCHGTGRWADADLCEACDGTGHERATCGCYACKNDQTKTKGKDREP